MRRRWNEFLKWLFVDDFGPSGCRRRILPRMFMILWFLLLLGGIALSAALLATGSFFLPSPAFPEDFLENLIFLIPPFLFISSMRFPHRVAVSMLLDFGFLIIVATAVSLFALVCCDAQLNYYAAYLFAVLAAVLHRERAFHRSLRAREEGTPV